MADDFVSFDATSMKRLTRDLHEAAAAFRREADKTLERVGRTLVESAKVKAAEHSTKIAATITMHTEPGQVVIRAGNEDTPTAVLYEFGNKKSRVSATSFRHPVFGRRDVWVEQAKYPYLRPALREDRRTITREMEQTWTRALGPWKLAPEGIV